MKYQYPVKEWAELWEPIHENSASTIAHTLRTYARVYLNQRGRYKLTYKEARKAMSILSKANFTCKGQPPGF
jgi:hypothetical protein